MHHFRDPEDSTDPHALGAHLTRAAAFLKAELSTLSEHVTARLAIDRSPGR